jgi:hypothetical protein
VEYPAAIVLPAVIVADVARWAISKDPLISRFLNPKPVAAVFWVELSENVIPVEPLIDVAILFTYIVNCM